MQDGFATFEGRQLAQIPQLFEDFWLYWRDIARTEEGGLALDVTTARTAGTNLAFRKDEMIFCGVKNSYGLFKSMEAIILAGGDEGEETLPEKVGNWGQRALLDAVKQGLGACWGYDGQGCHSQSPPSAMNRRPVQFDFKDGAATAFVPEEKDFDMVDLGIAKLHFEIGGGGGFLLWQPQRVLLHRNVMLPYFEFDHRWHSRR